MKKLLGVAIIVVLVAVNPMFRMFVGSDFNYGETEMRRAVEGAWVLAPEHAAPIRFTVMERGRHVPREGLVRAAGACGDRSFVHTAGACDSSSTLDLAIASSDIAVVRADFRAFGPEFTFGILELDAGNRLQVTARVAADGLAKDVHLEIDGHEVAATLARM